MSARLGMLIVGAELAFAGTFAIAGIIGLHGTANAAELRSNEATALGHSAGTHSVSPGAREIPNRQPMYYVDTTTGDVYLAPTDIPSEHSIMLLPACANEDGNSDGKPCWWIDPDSGKGYYVDSANYRVAAGVGGVIGR